MTNRLMGFENRASLESTRQMFIASSICLKITPQNRQLEEYEPPVIMCSSFRIGHNPLLAILLYYRKHQSDYKEIGG